MLSIIDTNCSRKPTVSAKTGCVDLVFEDDETAIAVRDAIAAEHPFEPKEPPAGERRRQLAQAWEAGYSAGWTDQQCDFPPHTADNPFKEDADE